MEGLGRSRTVVPFPSSEDVHPAPASLLVRVAVYEAWAQPPSVYDVHGQEPGDLLSELFRRVLLSTAQYLPSLPKEAVVAILENLLHAGFRQAVVSIDPGGCLRVSDRGPGIPDKTRAMLPGFTTATPGMQRYIRGVGSGLPLARQSMQRVGGHLEVDDNLGGEGTVVTLCLAADTAADPSPAPSAGPAPSPALAKPARFTRPATLSATPPLFPSMAPDPSPPALTGRQRRLLRLVADRVEVGPSVAAQHLRCSLTTAFRELVTLEAAGLLAAQPSGKRRLTDAGHGWLRGVSTATDG